MLGWRWHTYDQVDHPSKERYSMVLELVEGDTLYNWLKKSPKPPLIERCAALRDVARLMRSFEECKVVSSAYLCIMGTCGYLFVNAFEQVHGDLHYNNLMMRNGRIVMIDFGKATQVLNPSFVDAEWLRPCLPDFLGAESPELKEIQQMFIQAIAPMRQTAADSSTSAVVNANTTAMPSHEPTTSRAKKSNTTNGNSVAFPFAMIYAACWRLHARIASHVLSTPTATVSTRTGTTTTGDTATIRQDDDAAVGRAIRFVFSSAHACTRPLARCVY
jgi:serine/threonine protein kinase